MIMESESTLQQLFIALQERIAGEIPAIRFIDLDMSQLYSSLRPAIAFPAVLIDFDTISCTRLGNGVKAEVSITVTLAVDNYLPSEQSADTDTRIDALGFLGLEYALFAALHGFVPTVTERSALSFVGSRSLRNPEYRCRSLKFTYSYIIARQ